MSFSPFVIRVTLKVIYPFAIRIALGHFLFLWLELLKMSSFPFAFRIKGPLLFSSLEFPNFFTDLAFRDIICSLPPCWNTRVLMFPLYSLFTTDSVNFRTLSVMSPILHWRNLNHRQHPPPLLIFMLRSVGLTPPFHQWHLGCSILECGRIGTCWRRRNLY